MLYTGRDTSENRRLGLARLHRRGPLAQAPRRFSAATSRGMERVICDPAVEVDGSVIRVWFGGGDVASPDENLHGQIGMAILRPVSTTR